MYLSLLDYVPGLSILLTSCQVLLLFQLFCAWLVLRLAAADRRVFLVHVLHDQGSKETKPPTLKTEDAERSYVQRPVKRG